MCVCVCVCVCVRLWENEGSWDQKIAVENVYFSLTVTDKTQLSKLDMENTHTHIHTHTHIPARAHHSCTHTLHCNQVMSI